MADWNATLALTVHQNRYRESTVAEIDLGSLSNADIDTLAGLTQIDHALLKAIAADDIQPCRGCGTGIPDEADYPPVCQGCRRGDVDG